MNQENSILVFEGEKVRRTWFNNEWWFSVVDIVMVLTDSVDPKQYIKKMRSRDIELNSYWGTICTPLDLVAPDGKKRESNCSNLEGAFRIIQSIPSKKAEPFKRWLSKVGYQRVQEIENPELAQKRMKDLYRAKGYSDDWIEKRVRGIVIRDELTDEWKARGVQEKRDFAILTAEISKATFGMTPTEYKHHKSLKGENLRDHMNDLELIFSMLGERVSTEITRSKDAQGFFENKDAAKEGGEVAGNARVDAEKRIGKSIISDENYLENEEKKKLEKKD
jgi:DNA-damage-inducible protein D